MATITQQIQNRNQPVPYDQNFRLLTVPKSGTHLLGKLLTSIGYPKKLMGPPHHVTYVDSKITSFAPTKKNILLVRDCRDTLVSLVFHVDRLCQGALIEPNNPDYRDRCPMAKEWLSKSFDEKLMHAIRSDDSVGYTFVWASLDQWHAAKNLIPKLVSTPHEIILIKFEDLIGSKGGGSDLKQEQTIKKIVDFVGKNVTAKEIHALQEELFGGTLTFRKGQIGDWKNHFKAEHVEAFLPVFQTFLECFGYENNSNWADEYLEVDKLQTSAAV